MQEFKSHLYATKEEICQFDKLYASMCKCKHGVSWKPSVKGYTLHGLENTLIMEQQLKQNQWKNGKAKEILIGYPKRRIGKSISFKDRQYQRSLNDNALYPIMANGLVYQNAACQKDKGPDFARHLIAKYLRKTFLNYGYDALVAQADVHGYYENIQHDKAEDLFAYNLPQDICGMTTKVLRDQYSGEVGYSPGSQMVQILGISYLSSVDHYLKDQKHYKTHIRYQDDFWAIFHEREEAESYLNDVVCGLNKLGLTVNPKKTKLVSLKDGFMFLGFIYHLTKTGKIIMTLDPRNVRHERNKLYHLSVKVKKGEKDRAQVDESFEDWKEYASHGNSYQLINRMQQYYNSLWK